MSRHLALGATIILVYYLFWMDRKNNANISNALWVPFSWIFFIRAPSMLTWLNIGTSARAVSTDVLEGNPFARNIYLILIGIGIFILIKRKIDWRNYARTNIFIWLYFIFGAMSILWSDYPFVSFKRLIKASGVVIMVLVIMTEKNPYEAIGVLLKRISFVLLPFSVLFIKYYPELGRAYHMGIPMYTGVAAQKNGLGGTCLLSLIFYIWNLLFGRLKEVDEGQQLHFTIYLIMLPMIVWTLVMANSATSLACSIFAASILLIARLPMCYRNPSRFIPLCISAIIVFGALEQIFAIKDTIIVMLGRRPDLTTRVPMWQFLIEMVSNPMIGEGYESFWLGERLFKIQQRWGPLIQAHNGYLEMYLNMGFVGLFFIVSWVMVGIRNVQRHILDNYPVGILRLCFIAVVILYNYTEAAFYGGSAFWILLFIGIIFNPAQESKSFKNNMV